MHSNPIDPSRTEWKNCWIFAMHLKKQNCHTQSAHLVSMAITRQHFRTTLSVLWHVLDNVFHACATNFNQSLQQNQQLLWAKCCKEHIWKAGLIYIWHQFPPDIDILTWTLALRTERWTKWIQHSKFQCHGLTNSTSDSIIRCLELLGKPLDLGWGERQAHL